MDRIIQYVQFVLVMYMVLMQVNCELTSAFGDGCEGPDGSYKCVTTLDSTTCVFVQNHSAVDIVLRHGLHSVPATTTQLNLTFCDEFDVGYPYVQPAINLTAIRRLRQLQTLVVTSPACMGTPSYMKDTPLIVGRDTFVGLNLSHVQINIPVLSHDYSRAFAHLKTLKRLDLKWTMSLGYKNLCKLFCALPANSLSMVNVSNFQSPGRHGYFSSIHFARLFCRRNQSELTVLDLSWNGLAFIDSGIIDYAINLRHIDVSHNLLVDNANSPFLMMMSFLPYLKTASASFQGYPVNGNPPPLETCKNTSNTGYENDLLLHGHLSTCLDKLDSGLLPSHPDR